jgi:hypothetical protein
MSILVKGSPTEKIIIHIGLNQRDPLTSLWFLLVADGFSGLMMNAERIGLFKGFGFMRKCFVVSHLQYVDNTLCIGKATVDNI